MPIGCFDEGRRERLLKVFELPWTECGVGSCRWWETAPADAPRPRAVVIWLRDLGRVAWWISDDGATLALGYVNSLAEPSDEVVDAAALAELRYTCGVTIEFEIHTYDSSIGPDGRVRIGKLEILHTTAE